LIKHKYDPKLLKLQAKFDAKESQLKEMKSRSTKAFFRAKNLVEKLKKKQKFP